MLNTLLTLFVEMRDFIAVAWHNLLLLFAELWAAITSMGGKTQEYIDAGRDLVELYFTLLMIILDQVLFFLELTWRMAMALFDALRSDGYTSAEIFGHDISLIPTPNGNMSSASLLYFVVVGFMMADSVLVAVPATSVLMYVAIAIMSFGMILWTLRQLRHLLPVS